MKCFFIVFVIVLAIGCTQSKPVDINNAQVGNLQDLVDTLVVEKRTKIKIYSTGELNPEWANFDPEYVGKDDDIEIFFQSFDQNLKKIVFKESSKTSDTLDVTIDHVRCKQFYDKVARKFIATVTIPIKALLINNLKEKSVEFDVAVGDNDNGIGQKSKIAWASAKDPLRENKIHGALLLLDKNMVVENKNVLGITKNASLVIDWSKQTPISIKNLVHGEINDEADLSASFKGVWNNEFITVRFEINDSKEGKFKNDQLLQDDNFVDKGWIENEAGVKVWKMNLLHSKHAGGARKNQYCDTTIILPQGKYIVRYTSDESHSFGKWDAPGPNHDFWGIKISW